MYIYIHCMDTNVYKLQLYVHVICTSASRLYVNVCACVHMSICAFVPLNIHTHIYIYTSYAYVYIYLHTYSFCESFASDLTRPSLCLGVVCSSLNADYLCVPWPERT